jgi:anti-anti-sigma factor
MDAGEIRVSSIAGHPACVIKVSGELTLMTEREFAIRVAEALGVCPGPVLFDVSGLDFVDCSGARALVRAVRAVPPGQGRLHGCGRPVRRVLDALGYDLPYMPGFAGEIRARPRPRVQAGVLSRGEALTALIRVAESNAGQSALQASDVMARLASTYSELALNSRYRTQGKSEDRGRLLALSGRARDLSRQYLRHAEEHVPAGG